MIVQAQTTACNSKNFILTGFIAEDNYSRNVITAKVGLEESDPLLSFKLNMINDTGQNAYMAMDADPDTNRFLTVYRDNNKDKIIRIVKKNKLKIIDYRNKVYSKTYKIENIEVVEPYDLNFNKLEVIDNVESNLDLHFCLFFINYIPVSGSVGTSPAK